ALLGPRAPATTVASSPSVPDALPILIRARGLDVNGPRSIVCHNCVNRWPTNVWGAVPATGNPCAYRERTIHRHRGPGVRNSWKRSEEHTSELQSRENLVCRLLPETKQ